MGADVVFPGLCVFLSAGLLLALVHGRRVGRRADRQCRHLAAITDTMSEGFYVVDGDDRIVMANVAAGRILGYTQDDLIGACAHALFHARSADDPDPVPLDECRLNRAVRERRAAFLDVGHFRHRSGRIIAVEVSCNPVTDTLAEEGRRGGVLGWLFDGDGAEGAPGTLLSMVTFVDITARRESEAAVIKLSHAVEQSSASIVITDADGLIEYANPAFTKISGYTAQEAIGRRPSILKSGLVPAETYRALWQTITNGGEWRGEFHNRRKDGTLYWEMASISPIRDARGQITNFVAVKDDVTERKAIESELYHRANYDALTGLPNRQLLLDRVSTALDLARRHDRRVAVMFMDIDRFKQINDSMGHAAGDVLLKQAASRLAAVLRPQDTLGRLGGDEFLVVAPGLRWESEATALASRLLDVARRPFTIDGREVYVSVSIGVSLGPVDGTTAQALMRNADAAMYLAKGGGRDAAHFFTPDIEAAARRRMLIENGLRTAVSDGSLYLALQPIIACADDTMIKAEALLRWTHPQLGGVPPSEFIPIAEESGLIRAIGAWVIEEAARILVSLDPPRDGAFRLGINIASSQFTGGLHHHVAGVLARYDLDPRMLEIEITERMLLDPSPAILEQVDALRAMGVSIAIDDFGTGYSALSYLSVFHVDTLKIDRAFVLAMTDEARSQALIGAIVAMGHELGCAVVAEGVETGDQARLLGELAVDALQGYFLGRPTTAEAIIDRLAPGSARPHDEGALGVGFAEGGDLGFSVGAL
ncbi:GGDEF domain-containing protein [Rhodospirillum rubrum]|uniref:sensor domain-containing protein n=1 Tax=Rhodospirillum rubrum TaxID=1085 RepID=UPI001904747E|nr:EAL domain-containing protein [Rhodospirillum rubrum]MBK1663335.1 GGDEF domain-containing protein [Rhodospirillum rubrum]MBK1675146.1 GGDEF domain-containing protein [Rhodospirillum rubrum]